MQKPLLVSIVGGSGSGKSTIIEKLKSSFHELHPAILSMDNYYLPKAKQSRDKNDIWNFDLPTAFDLNKFELDVKHLLEGRDVELEEYMFENFHATPEIFKIETSRLIIIEGIFALHHEPVRQLVNYQIYVHADKKTRLNRRMIRDQESRGLKDDIILYQWKNHVKPAHKKYVKGHRSKADIVIDNRKHFKEDLEEAIEQIRKKLESVTHA